MIDLPIRHRPLPLLASVVLVQVLLLAFQIKRDHEVRLVRLWSVELLTPLQRLGNWTIHEIGNGWQGYIDLRGARRENQDLRAQVERLELRNRELESRAAEGDRLAILLGFQQAHAETPMLTAEVVGASADAVSKTIYINRGSRDGVRKNMGVITPDGVVGKVAEAFTHASQVLLITDRESGVGALLATARTHGVVKGMGDPLARMEYVVNEERVADGELILTSGEDRIFPKDLPIGTVATTQEGNPFKVIIVRPAARLDRLEEVIVLLTQQDLNLKRELEAAVPSANTPGKTPQTKPVNPGTAKPMVKPAAAKQDAAKPESVKQDAGKPKPPAASPLTPAPASAAPKSSDPSTSKPPVEEPAPKKPPR